MMAAPEIIVAGCGIVTPFGYGVSTLADAVFCGYSALEPVEKWASNAKEAWVGRLHPAGREAPPPLVAAVDEALKGVVVAPDARWAVVVPTCATSQSMLPPPRNWPPDPIPLLRAHIPSGFQEYRTSAACSSTSVAIVLGQSLLRGSLADVVLVAGICTLNPYDYQSLAATGAMDRGPARPFDAQRGGMSLGEGAGAIVLTQADDPMASTGDKRPLARLFGAAALCRSRRPRTVDLEADTAEECMRRALPPSGAVAVDLVSAHAVGTRQGDQAECAAIAELLRGDVPVTSHKGATGHLLHCSGFVAVALACESLRRQQVAPSVGTSEPDPGLTVRHIPVVAEDRAITTVLINNFGFAGNYASLTLGAI